MVNLAKKLSNEDGPGYLRNAFVDIESRLQRELLSHSQIVTHDGSRGGEGENEWIKVLKDLLPKRYKVKKGLVVNSQGRTSDQIDCLIIDNFYTPKLYGFSKTYYVPVEAVYGVFEIKPEVNAAHMKYASKKIKSVRKLMRTTTAFAGETEKVDRESKPIIGGLFATHASWADKLESDAFDDALAKAEEQETALDFVITTKHGYAERHPAGDVSKIAHTGATVRAFFRLFSRLQEIGTVAAVDLDAYATTAWGTTGELIAPNHNEVE